MSGLAAFLRGLGFRAARPALYIWFFNMIFAFFIYWGFYRMFIAIAGKSTIASGITLDTGVFSFLIDIAHQATGNYTLLSSLALLILIMFTVVSIFAAGGIYSALVRDERTTISNLIASSVENFLDMVKISLVNILNWVVAAIIPILMMLILVNFKALNRNETVSDIYIYAWIAITLLIITFSISIYDFSRIFRLKEDRNTFYAFKQAILFTFTNKLNILAIFISYAITLAILLLVYFIFSQFLEKLLPAFFLFILYQGFIIARYFLKVAVIRAEIKVTEFPG